MNTPIPYPKTYYELEPLIIQACDHLDHTYGTNLPPQEMVEKMTDWVYESACTQCPDLASLTADGMQTQQPFLGRILFRDFIGFLLLFNLFRRRNIPCC